MTDDSGAVPSKGEILRYLEQADEKITKRELARAFSVKGADRVGLKKRLKEMVDEGALERDSAKALRPAGRLPSVTVVEVIGADAFGDMMVRPLKWEGDAPPPRIYLAAGKQRRGRSAALARGDRALVRLSQNEDGVTYSATVMKKLEAAGRTVLGVFRGGELGGRVTSVDKRARDEYLIDAGDVGAAQDGDLVTAELLPHRRGRVRGLKPTRIVERHGDVSETRSISLIAIHEQGLPTDFSESAVKEAEAAKPVKLGKREDLREIPLITIDPVDARDHDDAIFAEPDPDPQNKGGWHLIVAIADVAYYVRPASALDGDARTRGNSAYFPDRVVPMLPEALSTDMCSLKPGVDRACLAVHIRIDKDGNKRSHKFVRGLMRSHANIAYEHVQAAIDGAPTPQAAGLLEPALKPLYAAHDALDRARAERGPLKIQSEEKKILLNERGEVADIVPRMPIRAHRVIEDFMVLANVCAAETLEAKRTPCMYRVHEEPALDKLEALREFLQTLDFKLAKAQTVSPRVFNKVLDRFAGTPHQRLVNDVVLRSQTQAYYSPDNKGHFGLALDRYAHFTSPIRRYSDLIVHRGLVRALSLSDDGADALTDAEMSEMDAIGEHISMTERRAMMAERASIDRYLASFLAARVGQVFKGRISGVTRFGLFVTLEPMGGDGLVPVSTMIGDYYRFEEHRHALVGQRHGHQFQLGDRVEVRLNEAVPVSGGLKLELVGEPQAEGGSTRRTDGPARPGRPPHGQRRSKSGKTAPGTSPKRKPAKIRKSKGKRRG